MQTDFALKSANLGGTANGAWSVVSAHLPQTLHNRSSVWFEMFPSKYSFFFGSLNAKVEKKSYSLITGGKLWKC